MKIIFYILEIFAFILPAIPDSFSIRFSILLCYLIAHICKANKLYSKFKKKYN